MTRLGLPINASDFWGIESFQVQCPTPSKERAAAAGDFVTKAGLPFFPRQDGSRLSRAPPELRELRAKCKSFLGEFLAFCKARSRSVRRMDSVKVRFAQVEIRSHDAQAEEGDAPATGAGNPGIKP